MVWLIEGGLRTLFLIEVYINRVFNIRYLFFLTLFLDNRFLILSNSISLNSFTLCLLILSWQLYVCDNLSLGAYDCCDR